MVFQFPAGTDNKIVEVYNCAYRRRNYEYRADIRGCRINYEKMKDS